jgi:hypothetical protein
MAYYLALNPLRFAIESPQMLRRLTRVIGTLAVDGTFNALGHHVLRARGRVGVYKDSRMRPADEWTSSRARIWEV